MMHDVRFTSDLRHLQQDTGGKGQGCCKKVRRAPKAVRTACFQNSVEVSCIHRKNKMKATADDVSLKKKQKRFKIAAFSYALTVIYKCSTGNQIMFARQ